MYAEVQNDLESIDELADNQVENGLIPLKCVKVLLVLRLPRLL